MRERERKGVVLDHFIENNPIVPTYKHDRPPMGPLCSLSLESLDPFGEREFPQVNETRVIKGRELRERNVALGEKKKEEDKERIGKVEQ